MSDEPVVTLAYLGWSNMRGGTELYSEESGNGRWVPRRVADPKPWGDLLADELAEKGVHEGSYIVVVAFPSRFDKAKAQAFLEALVPSEWELYMESDAPIPLSAPKPEREVFVDNEGADFDD